MVRSTVRVSSRTTNPDLFTVEEVAMAAGVSAEQAWHVVRLGQAIPFGNLVSARDAVRLIRVLKGIEAPSESNRAPLVGTPDPHRRAGRGLMASGLLHVFGVAFMLLMASLGLLSANDTEQQIKDPTPIRLVYLMQPGPGGGGGGGGLKTPLPPPPAARKAALIKKTVSPVPPARRKAAPPPPTPPPPRPPPPRPEPPKIQPPVIEPPKPAPPQSVQAPVASVPTDPTETTGVLSAPPAPPQNGPGTGGGAGTGAGQGIGEGTGGGIGPGTGGGTGGGPYQPGAGIDPPTVVREVRPSYTEEARRRSIEGDVVLEIVVKADGSVGTVQGEAHSRRGA